MFAIEEQLIKNRISKRFNFVADEYLKKCELQKRVNKELIASLEAINITPKTILDLGGGAGNSVMDLHRLFPTAEIFLLDIAEKMLLNAKNLSNTPYTICADFDYLPFKENTFDLIFSNLSLQWSLNFEHSLPKIKSTLKKNGLLVFSVLGDRSLSNIKQAWFDIEQQPHINDFITYDKLGHVLYRHFSNYKVFSQDIVLNYPDMKSMIHSFKAVGANCVINTKLKGLTGKNKFKKFIANLKQKQNNSWQVEYKILYCLADIVIPRQARDLHP